MDELTVKPERQVFPPEERVLELLRESGAMLEGHFLLSSGRHSDRYFQCAKLLQYPDRTLEVFAFVANTPIGMVCRSKEVNGEPKE